MKRIILVLILVLCLVSCGGDSSNSDSPNNDANPANTGSVIDSDNDGVNDDLDACPDTPVGATVDANGCADSQVDTDNDGITVNLDLCPNTPDGATVDENGCADSQVFISSWDTSYGSKSINLPIDQGGTYNFYVNWGDGTSGHITQYNQAETIHEYEVAGIYDIQMSGIIDGFGFYNSRSSDSNKLIDIKNWGNVKLHNKGYQFIYAENLTGFSATDAPDLSNITNLSYMFSLSSVFNGDIAAWDVGSVTNMEYMFHCAISFNQDIGSWDVGNVTDMGNMFSGDDWGGGDTVFNQDLGSWNVNNVTDMVRMFFQASSFNQNLESWNVNNITDMGQMFVESGLEGNEPSWYH